MATDEEISQALLSLFCNSSSSSSSPNPNKSITTTTSLSSLNDVVQQLQSKLGHDLSHKVDFIRSQIRQLFQPPPPHKDHFALHQPHNFQPTQYSAAPASSATATPAGVLEPPKQSAQPKAKRRGGPGGLNKLCGVSPELQAIVGQPELPRTEIVKQLWAYIRKNNLQDPNNKRKIICNDELRIVFETDCTDMFKMNKLLAKHIIPLEPTKESSSKKLKVDAESGMRSIESGPYVMISEALANFFGVGEREMLQAEVLRRLWEYIKANHLEDPLNSMVILCDAKLQGLFGCESVPALGIPEILARHHIRRR